MMISIDPASRSPLGPVLRTADRMRLEGCVNALAKEGLSLALHCSHEALLDHYAGLLLGRMRSDQASHQIEIYFPSNTESLIQRFNSVLSDQDLSEATRPARDAQACRVWVVHDAQKVSDAEMQLLARLIHNFPGARIRALLLFHQPGGDPPILASFGRKLLRWDIELPTPAQALDALELAQADGTHPQVAQLLRRIGCNPQATTPLSLGLEAQAQADLNAKRHPEALKLNMKTFPGLMASSLRHAMEGLRQVKPPKWNMLQPTSKRLLVGVAVALMTSLTLMAWLQPQAFHSRPPSAAPTKAPDSAPVKPAAESSKTEQKQGPIGLFRSSYGVKS